jgi:hypothetical protein
MVTVVEAIDIGDRRHGAPPLWDGRASERIGDIVVERAL